VVDVSGSQTVITKSNLLGNNACFNSAGFTDPYTLAADAINNNEDGLFPLLRPVPPSAPGEAGPWEWYDSTSLVVYAQLIGLSASAGTAAYVNGLATNPDMSKAKALAYIDTVQHYLNDRIAYCLPLFTGLNEQLISANQVQLYPNPASDRITVQVEGANILSLNISDLRGRVIRSYEPIGDPQFTMERGTISDGIYLVEIKTAKGRVTKKLVIE
jgi:hypothetical protein